MNYTTKQTHLRQNSFLKHTFRTQGVIIHRQYYGESVCLRVLYLHFMIRNILSFMLKEVQAFGNITVIFHIFHVICNMSQNASWRSKLLIFEQMSPLWDKYSITSALYFNSLFIANFVFLYLIGSKINPIGNIFNEFFIKMIPAYYVM